MPPDTTSSSGTRRQRLVQRRKTLGLTQEELAELMGVGRSTVVRWERGESEPLPWIRPRLARALKVSPNLLENLLTTDDQPGAATVPRQLPAAVADFTGRAAELQRLTEVLNEAEAARPGTVVISAIGGMAGVGKTTLALHWAHQVSDQFPGGQLYANLRGFDPSGTPLTPAEAIRGFLDALGVAAEVVPAGAEAQAGLYRSLLAGQRMLVVLDNARDEQQVRPLLPAAAGTLVLVTSRSQLAGLAAADGARLLPVDALTPAEAAELLAARIGSTRAAAEPGPVAEIADLCACLPLAVAIAAARAAARPSLPLAALAEELRNASGRLDALDAGDPAASVRAVFSWSVRHLSRGTARMFWLLGVHPGPDISSPAAASLAGSDLAQARRCLGELARAHLITEHLPDRYTFHDLLRAYAAEHSEDISEAERDAAVGRVLDHYLHTAAEAALLLNPSHEPVVLAPPDPGTSPEQPADHKQALAWFEDEHQVLLAAVALAVRSGSDVHAWQLAWALTPFLQTRGHMQEWAGTQRVAHAAATRLDEALAQAVSSRLLAVVCSDLGNHDEAGRLCAESLTLYQRLGNRLGEAKVHFNLATALADGQGRLADALGHAEQALRLYQAMGDKASEATALNNAGWIHGQLGDYQQARALCRQALSLCEEVGHLWLEGHVWDSLGYAERHLGNLAEAASCYQRALSRYREAGDRLSEAIGLGYLGDTCQAAGQRAQAREAWQEALAIFDELRNPEAADEIRAKLASADGLPPSQPP
jgi:tetratricopeptide (TPR) repeat protein/transcriptional regulator with XRE-family HTH domain